MKHNKCPYCKNDKQERSKGCANCLRKDKRKQLSRLSSIKKLDKELTDEI